MFPNLSKNIIFAAAPLALTTKKAPAAKGPGAKAPAAKAAAAPAPVPAPSRSRRLLIGDLHRVAAALKLDLSHHDRPSALFAVFDAQEGRVAAGEAAAKALHTQLLPRLAGHRGQWTSEEVREALAASLGDALAASEGGGEGVAAAAALLLVPRLVVATWGGARHSLLAPQRQATELQALVAGAEGGAAAQPSDGGAPEVAKKPGAQASGSEPSGRITPLPKVLPPLPEHMLAQRGSASASSVQAVVVDLDFGGRFQTLALLARAEQPEDVLPEAEIAAVAGQVASSHRPRAGCRALIQSARSCGAQGSFIVCLVNFLWAAPVDSSGAPRAKRPRIEVQDKVRVRHILLRHAASTAPMDKVQRKKVTRSLEEAEERMFEVLGELEADPSHFTAVCREISECQSCLKGGELAGDIGWLSREKPLANMPEVSKAPEGTKGVPRNGGRK